MGREQLVVCVGVMKAGTTSLYGLLRQHSQVCVTEKKETGFFYQKDLYKKGYEWFLEECFPKYALDQLLFEADPNYMYFSRCIARIHHCNPEAKIIVMLRNPADRAFSHYMMMKKWALEELSFEEACAAEQDRILMGEWQQAHFGYVDRGRYAKQVDAIRQFFPREQVYYVLFEEFVQDQQSVLDRLREWLGLQPQPFHPVNENVASRSKNQLLTKLLHQPRYKILRKVVGKMIGGNKALNYKVGMAIERFNQIPYSSTGRPHLDPQMRERLLVQLTDDIRKVEMLTGLNTSDIWLNKA